MALTKRDIVDQIAESMELPFKQASGLIETLLETIKRSLENGESLLISGFGKFNVKEKSERAGRNPATSEDMVLPKRRVVTLKCARNLRERVNGRR